MSITSHWRVAVAHGFDKLDDGDLNLTALEAESQIELITLEGDGLDSLFRADSRRPSPVRARPSQTTFISARSLSSQEQVPAHAQSDVRTAPPLSAR